MAITEDELANALIQHHKSGKKDYPDIDDFGVFPEAHYNHYGNRGVADLYLTMDDWDGHLYELKSESAVQQATGANEIIRQFNKMREFFFKGSSHSVPRKNLRYELCFTPSEHNFRHIARNADMYDSVVRQDISGVRCERISVRITLRQADPDNITPVIMFSDNIDFRDGIGEGTFPEYVKNSNRKVFDEYEAVIREISDDS